MQFHSGRERLQPAVPQLVPRVTAANSAQPNRSRTADCLSMPRKRRRTNFHRNKKTKRNQNASIPPALKMAHSFASLISIRCFATRNSIRRWARGQMCSDYPATLTSLEYYLSRQWSFRQATKALRLTKSFTIMATRQNKKLLSTWLLGLDSSPRSSPWFSIHGHSH